MKAIKHAGTILYRWRLAWVALGLVLVLFGLICRMLYLGVIDRDFLLKQSNARTLRLVKMPAHRGMITDRNWVPLAISTPIDSVWVNAHTFHAKSQQIAGLAKLLHVKPSWLQHRLQRHQHSHFLYLKRHIPPGIVARIRQMHLSGLFFEHGYKRYYPQGAVTAHMVGLTNVDDRGQEGMELAYNQWLHGVPGKQWVLKDRMGHVVDTLKTLHLPQQGHNLALSIDHRIQYLAYRELQAGVQKAHAKSGSVVVLDVNTGEVLAMVNQPVYNPNNRSGSNSARYRNRAVTDTFEPGSTMKAFSLSSAIASGRYQSTTRVDTNPGRLKVGKNWITDEHLNHGVLSVSDVLKKSSNVGTAKIILSLPDQHLWHFLKQMGFGESTKSGFPGEVSGSLTYRAKWKPFALATLSFGYGVTVTTLQLARAYAIIANGGIKKPVFLVHQHKKPRGERVLDGHTAKAIRQMLETVLQSGGTGRRARVRGYRVAGKTGTAYIAGKHGYDQHRYIASFVGMAPMSKPRFVIAVVIKEPDRAHHYGGIVAAPIFSKIMAGTLRLYHVAGDQHAAH